MLPINRPAFGPPAAHRLQPATSANSLRFQGNFWSFLTGGQSEEDREDYEAVMDTGAGAEEKRARRTRQAADSGNNQVDELRRQAKETGGNQIDQLRVKAKESGENSLDELRRNVTGEDS